MANPKLKAKLVLLELDAFQEADCVTNASDALNLLNEILKDAKELAEEVLDTKKVA
jgi:hypothetical protein